MINNKTDIIGYMQLFFKFWPIGSPEEAYYMRISLNTFSVHLERSAKSRTKRNVYLKENISITRHTFLNVLLKTKTSAQKG